MADLKIALKVDAENPTVGDLYLENGTVRLTNTLAETVAQELYIRYKFFQGEWFLDRTQGFPWFQSVLGIKTPLGVVRQLMLRVLTTCPGVSSVVSFKVTRLPNRGILLNFQARLSDGTTLTERDFGAFVLGGPT